MTELLKIREVSSRYDILRGRCVIMKIWAL